MLHTLRRLAFQVPHNLPKVPQGPWAREQRNVRIVRWIIIVVLGFGGGYYIWSPLIPKLEEHRRQVEEANKRAESGASAETWAQNRRSSRLVYLFIIFLMVWGNAYFSGKSNSLYEDSHVSFLTKLRIINVSKLRRHGLVIVSLAGASALLYGLYTAYNFHRRLSPTADHYVNDDLAQYFLTKEVESRLKQQQQK